MTKRNMFLVSLFLVFGLVATATSALATAWTVNGNEYFDGRAEGLAEATGQVALTLNAGGTITPTNNTQMGFQFTYSAPVIAGTAGVHCTTNIGSVFASGCGSALVSPPLVVGHVVTIYFATGSYPFATGDGSEITLTVRVNATGLAGASVSCSVRAIAPGSSSQVTLAGGNPQTAGTVLYVNPLPSLSLNFGTTETNSSGTVKTSVAANVLSCIGVQDVSTYDNRFCINVDEAFPNALTSESYEIGLDPGSGSGDVTNGTTFTVTFPDVPTGMSLEWQSTTPCYLLNSSTPDPNYCLGGSLGVTGPGTPTITANVGSMPATQSVSFTFTVVSEDAGSAENMDICFKIRSRGQLPPGYSPVTVQVAMGPATPTSDIPLFTGNTEATPTLDVIDISDCQTFLLFPYVTDTYNYDTGLSVSNTTMDPFNTDPTLSTYLGKGSAYPQTGSCTFYIYSMGALAAQFPAGPISPGSTLSFYLTGEAPGANGYAIAVCNFQNAHGQATIQYNIAAGSGFETGYLADVLPNPQWYHRSPAGTGLGETAVAPYLLSPRLVKELNGFHH